jgi:EmrB/QacA subfamily drug resistance transporter
MRPTGTREGRSFNALSVLLSASTGCAMTVLDTNIVAIVLPSIARDLGASFDDVEWVISTYVLCFASLLLPAGSIADRFGRRKVFLCGIGTFALASVLCGAAPTATALYLARTAQGVGAAFLLAPALAIIGHAFHDEAERARAWAIWGGIMGLTMVLAPIIGGVIAYGLGWRWAFYVNVPVCAFLGAAVLPFIQESRDGEAQSLDPSGIILFAASMLGLTWGLIDGQAKGWLSTSALLGFAGGFAAFIGFLAAETNQARPMLDLALFRLPRFIGAVLAMFAYAASAQVMAQLLPLYLQNGLGLPPLDAGLAMLPFAIAMLILPQIGQWLGRYLASHQILALGLSVVCLGNLVTAWGAAGSLWPLLVLGMIILGSGGGLLNGDTQKAIMGAVPRERAGMASGISTTSRFSGILLGFVVLSTIMAIVARAALRTTICASVASRCEAATEFARLVAAGDVPKAVALMSPVSPTIATEIAHRGYAAGFVAALLTAAIVAGLSAVVVVIQMRSVRGRPLSQTAFAVVEEHHCVSKPILSAAPVRAGAARPTDAAAGGTEREESCSA